MSRRILLVAGMLLTIVALMAWIAPQSAQAQLPPPTPTNPPPTWTPGPPAEKTPTPTPRSEPGGTSQSVITLRVECPGAQSNCLRLLMTLRTQVEAQADQGVWRPVDGWTSPLTEFEESSGRISWWFGDKKPPRLRWLITDEGGRTRLITSEVFQPAPGTTTMVTVTLPVVQPLLPASGAGSPLAPLAATGGVAICLFTLIACRPDKRS